MDNKSRHGNDFKEEVLEALIRLREEGVLSKVESSKRILNKSGNYQFYAPFYAEKDHQRYAIFSTTSARSDRIKINQWDANGIKLTLGDSTRCILVLPDELSQSEDRHFRHEAERIAEDDYVSALDNIIKLKDLEGVL